MKVYLTLRANVIGRVTAAKEVSRYRILVIVVVAHGVILPEKQKVALTGKTRRPLLLLYGLKWFTDYAALSPIGADNVAKRQKP